MKTAPPEDPWESLTEEKVPETEPSSKSPVVPYDPLQRYLYEINRYPLLTPEEEKKLLTRYQESPDSELAYKLITSNLRLVVKIAMEFQRYWMQNLLDLIQEGNIGLMQAIKKFDPFRGIKFSYYASFWIKAYILKFIMDNWKLVKIGTTQAQRKLFYNLKKEKGRLMALGIDPVPKLLSEKFSVSEKEIIEMDQRLGEWELSLDAPVAEDSSVDHKSILPAHEASPERTLSELELKNIFKTKLKNFQKGLTPRENIIFEKRILAEEPLTLQDLGDQFEVSRERIRQLEEKLLKKVKAYLEKEIPDLKPDYLQETP
ncbi:MAG: RNA polymerase factor sigma-32 [Deltaproteobacteria bacterium]|nr:RNA polymerase factor sigma-32 [Deltaproteobacteria bacterium]